eukprot:CAMPEP_0169112074 /NCGR_PEP_ID=MMETSP1015-20121227/27431_1 /TAXON_ID=342587 /ORGANISM="Karlodinium micrum, Strain CCMP2283" /LENGTH=531 /DNA_ID=CAMNT_0009174067 /DNA_START=52 /DNA_END=1647 /DNA_ORIENTATION=+
MGICQSKSEPAKDRCTEAVVHKQILSVSEPGPLRMPGPVECMERKGRADDPHQNGIKSGMISQHMFILEHLGKNVKDHYTVDKEPLGIGAFGSVCKGKHKKTRANHAIKAISKSRTKDVGKVKQEISIMKTLDHPNIIKLFETFEDRRNIYLVMELCFGGELFDRILKIGRFAESHVAALMQQILRAVLYMHKHDICHRDLKPENFLFLSNDSVGNDVLKLIDFGLSCKCSSSDSLKTRAGTVYYIAPEVLTGTYNKACDLWSCGVIMYVLLCAYPPFHGESDSDVLAKVRRGNYSFKYVDWKGVTEDAKELIRLLLQKDARERCTAEQALSHFWISGTAPKADTSTSLDDGFVERLRDFQAANHFKKAALHVIAGHMSHKQIKSLREAFIALDADGDGLLTMAEMQAGMTNSGFKEIPSDLQEIISQVDSNRSGVIDYTEFLAATISKKLYVQEDVCWKAFSVFDQNGDGMISKEELQKVLHDSTVEEELGAQRIEVLMKEVDANGDGMIDFDEFMCMMQISDSDIFFEC